MKGKILIVEDDISLFNIYSTELRIKGYDVINVADGLSAKSKIIEYKPDLVMLDIMLPGMNGLNILQEVKEDPETANVPVVMLTNYGSEDNVKKALEAGAADYIMKYKILPAELHEKVELILGQAKSSDIKITG